MLTFTGIRIVFSRKVVSNNFTIEIGKEIEIFEDFRAEHFREFLIIAIGEEFWVRAVEAMNICEQ